MPIPRIIHQTAATAELPAWSLPLRERIAALHPGWDLRLYDDAACRELVRQALPSLLPMYDGYSTAIQRVDLFRVVAVWAAGGFYLDLDIACERALDVLCDERLVLAEESTLRIANYMFGSERRHPFWLEVLAEMEARAGRAVTCDEDVLESTGPGMVTDVYHRSAALYAGIRLLRNDSLCCARCGGMSCRFGAFAAHLHAGSWRGVRGVPRTGAGVEPLVLRTYRGDAYDGLTSVFASASALGPVVDDTREFAGCRVLVAGVPFLYAARLSPHNVNVAYTTFESTRLPQHWVTALNTHYHACAVPHDAVARVFRDSGVHIPLHVVPQGFTRLPRMARRAPEHVFRVGFIGVPVHRKNLRTLFEACRRLHRTIPSLRLAIHVARWYDWADGAAWRDVAAAPFVEWTEGVRSHDEVAAWYASLSCYAYPSSAEGWSFTPRESMYLGIPTVVSAIPVHDELVRSGFCTVIPSRCREPAAFEDGVSGEWCAIDTDDVVHALEEVHGDPADAERKARDGARWIEDRWLAGETLRGLRAVLDSPGAL